MQKFWKNNSLSIVLFSLFGIFLIGLSITGYLQQNNELTTHGQRALAYLQYLQSGSFVEAVFENWESEFLQMAALVILTIGLRQKDSPDSKPAVHSRHAIIRDHLHKKGRAVGNWLYDNSLSIVLLGLFFISFSLHAMGGTAAHNQEAVAHHQAVISVWQYLASSQFWFESFQNWQSEFVAVGALIVLSIKLRQRGSPQSKAV